MSSRIEQIIEEIEEYIDRVPAVVEHKDHRK